MSPRPGEIVPVFKEDVTERKKRGFFGGADLASFFRHLLARRSFCPGGIAGETMRQAGAELAMYGGESFRGLRTFGDGHDIFRHRVRGMSGSCG